MSDSDTHTPPLPDDNIGYGKPPKATRFRKGISGNPKGRPKTAKPMPIRHEDQFSRKSFERTAYGVVKLRENGKTVERTRREAVDESMFIHAIKGHRLHAQYLDRKLTALEEKAASDAEDSYIFWRGYKWKAEAELQRCKSQGLKPPVYIPHPADIVIDPFKRKIHFLGPMSKEELPHYQALCMLRDYTLGKAMYDAKRCHGPRALPDKHCPYHMLSLLYNEQLPPSMRHDEFTGASRMMDWNVSLPQIRKRLQAIDRQLKALPPIDAEAYVNTYWQEKEKTRKTLDHLEMLMHTTEEMVRAGAFKDSSLDEGSAMVLEALKLRKQLKA